MNFLLEYERLIKSPLFLDFNKINSKAYLVHAFISGDEKGKSEWQIGYYLSEKDRLVTFFMTPEIKKSPESEIFKDPDEKISELKINKINCSDNEVIKMAKECMKKNYPSEIESKMILIIQNLPSGQVYNITFVTKSFNTVNIKVDSASSEIKSHQLTSLMDFRAK